jgi:hypothetical protein
LFAHGQSGYDFGQVAGALAERPLIRKPAAGRS